VGRERGQDAGGAGAGDGAVQAFDAFAAVAPEIVAAYKDESNRVMEHPVGTGPYRLKTWTRGQKIVLEANPGYRAVAYPAPGPGSAPGDAAVARARIKELLARRIAAQPLSLPNAGSVFRNPPGDHAARLVESCGLKGFAIGGARVSEKHANFIVNPARDARAADIEALIAHVRRVVRERTGVELEPEVRIIGVPKGGEA